MPDKPAACALGKRLHALGFKLVATRGTADELEKSGIQVQRLNKVAEGSPNAVDMLLAGEIHMVINTTAGEKAIRDSYTIRRQTLVSGAAYFTTIPAAEAAVGAVEAERGRPVEVCTLQEYHQALA